MPNDIADSAMWATAVTDIDAANHRRLVVQATVALAGTWPFLAAAQTTEEFEHRLALMQEQIEQRTPEHIRQEVVAGLREKWADMHAEEQQRTAMLRTAALRVEANEDGSLPQAYVHVHKHGSGDDAYHQIDVIGSPTFLQTIARVADEQDAMTKAREYALPNKLPLYQNGRYVEGKRIQTDEEYFDRKLGRWVKTASDPTTVKNVPQRTNYQPDPAADYRYRYPIPTPTEALGGQPSAPGSGTVDVAEQAAGSSIGADGFPIDVAQGEYAGAAAAMQNQLTPGQWVVPPNAGWPAASMPNAATGQVTGSRRTATEGAVPTPGPNPNYFSQGTQGLAGPPTFPENPSSGIEPKTDNHIDDGVFGGQPPEQSSGSAQGRVDDAGYTHQASLVLQETPDGGFQARMAGVDNFDVGWWQTREAALQGCDAYAEAYGRTLKVAVRKIADEHAPYRLTQDSDGWHVVNKNGARKNKKPFGSKDEARNFQKALYANVPGAAESASADEKRKGKQSSLESPPFGESAGERTAAVDYDDAPFFPPRRTRMVRHQDGYYPHPDYERALDAHECTCDFERDPNDSRASEIDPDCPQHGHLAGAEPRHGSKQHSEKPESGYFIQPMSGMVHTDDRCSVGTARYYPVPAVGSAAEIEENVRSGSLKSCKRCGPGVAREASLTNEQGWAKAKIADEDNPDTHRLRGRWDARKGRPYAGEELQDTESARAYRAGWDSVHNASLHQASTDGRIVGKCDHCGEPVRYHTEDGGHLRHLHNGSARCGDGKISTAMRRTEGGVEFRLPLPKDSMARQAAADHDRDYYTDINTPDRGVACPNCNERGYILQQHGPEVCSLCHGAQRVPRQVRKDFIQRRKQAAVLEAPTPENPTGRGRDDFDARTFDALVKQRPMQSPEERGANTPTVPREPIRKGPDVNTPQGARDRDEDDEDREDEGDEDD